MKQLGWLAVVVSVLLGCGDDEIMDAGGSDATTDSMVSEPDAGDDASGSDAEVSDAESDAGAPDAGSDAESDAGASDAESDADADVPDADMGDPVAEGRVVTDYRPHIAGQPRGVVWLGRRVALFIEGDTSVDDRDQETMNKILGKLDRMFAAFIDATGTEPPIASPYEGRIRVEASTDVGGGLAHHGRQGIAVGFGFFRGLYERTLAGRNDLDQVFFYEAARNFWTRDLNPRIDYHTADGTASWGWWTVGFNNAMACFLAPDIGVDLHYFGQNDEGFCIDNMLTKHNEYVSDPRWNWDNSWHRDLLPWRERTSVNDLMSGTLIHMYRQDYGGIGFVRRLYDEIRARTPLESRSDTQGARDNFYIAASRAARRDLTRYFAEDLKWELSDAARAEVAGL